MSINTVENQNNADDIIKVISGGTFSDLTDDIKKEVLSSMDDVDKRNGGTMGKFFGNKPINASIHVAFILCVLSLIVGMICQLCSTPIWEYVFPLIGAAIGFFFGKGTN